VSLPLITGLSGPALLDAERAFLEDAQPLGLILFARNIETPEQVAALVEDCRAILGPKCWVLIDQEGGRVARLRPPHWHERPAASRLGALPLNLAEEGAYLAARLMAHDLYELGINVDCHPVLDIPAPGGHAVIGDRAFGTDADTVTRLGDAACQGLLDGGVLPVIKHIPGHGRAPADSHERLPVVDAAPEELAGDFAPFAALSTAPIAMTAHVVYSAYDQENPATLSSSVIREVIRGRIGFEGVLLSDDLTMNALSGGMAARAEAAFQAGCDVVLHCNGRLDEMMELAVVCRLMDSPDIAARIEAATRRLRPPKPFDRSADEARLADLMAAHEYEQSKT
jgi:beta-N-acetylhexosaminidase